MSIALDKASRIRGSGMTSQRTRDRLAARLAEQGIRSEMVLQRIREVPRHLFMDEALNHRAYENTALPIGHGQTISQPYIVARMTELLLGDAAGGGAPNNAKASSEKPVPPVSVERSSVYRSSVYQGAAQMQRWQTAKAHLEAINAGSTQPVPTKSVSGSVDSERVDSERVNLRQGDPAAIESGTIELAPTESDHAASTAAQSLGRVLEVGTGSGYQAAVLAGLCEQVYTVERVRGLFRRTRLLFRELGMHNVQCALNDGSWGWPEEAPFDAIIVTAAAEEIPSSLLDQLVVGGRLVAPVGAQQSEQELVVLHKTAEGINRARFEPVNFVPFLADIE